MGSNILITGAAGFIGGSIVADILSSNSPLIEKENIYVAVRSKDQAKALSHLGINVLEVDLTNENMVIKELLQHKILIVVHTASSINESLALNLISALGKQREVSGEKTYFIHTSGDSAFHDNAGWKHGAIKDTGPMFELEKQSADTFPIRQTDVAVIERAKALRVISFIVLPPMVYGRGTGEWNKLSVLLPVVIKASISQKAVYRFPEDKKISAVHISDFTAFYQRIIEKALANDSLPSGKAGYFFGEGHDLSWWEILDCLAAALHARGLVEEPKARAWASNEAAAEGLGIPMQFVNVLWNSNGNVIAENKHKLGWIPVWDKERFLQNIDEEIDTVIELGEAKSSLLSSLHEATKV